MEAITTILIREGDVGGPFPHLHRINEGKWLRLPWPTGRSRPPAARRPGWGILDSTNWYHFRARSAPSSTAGTEKPRFNELFSVYSWIFMKEKCNLAELSPLMRAAAGRRDRGRRVGNSRFYKLGYFSLAVGAEFAREIERRCRVRCLWSACSCIIHMWSTALAFPLWRKFPEFGEILIVFGKFSGNEITPGNFVKFMKIWLLWFNFFFFFSSLSNC